MITSLTDHWMLFIWSAVLSFVLSLIITPFVRNFFLRHGFVDAPTERKRHTHAVPRVGGIAILLSYGLSLLVVYLVLTMQSRLPEIQTTNTIGILLAGVIVFITGLLDDLLTLQPWQKLGGQVLAALITISSGVQIHVISDHTLDPWLSIPVTLLWLIACSNALNLIDGLDGLATGIALVATITSGASAVIHGNFGLAVLTLPLIGSLCGFLRYNFNPASVFLGDCGSLSVGFLLGCYAILWGQKSATLIGMTAPAICLAIPLLDAGLAILRRYLRNQPIFLADRGHIHHRLLDRGLSVKESAFVLYSICGVFAVLSLIHQSSQYRSQGLIVVLFAVAVGVGINHLGYTEFAIARKLFSDGDFRRIIDERTRLEHLRRDLSDSSSLLQTWKILRITAHTFGLVGIRMCIAGRVFEDINTRVDQVWQLRITLTDQQYCNFYTNVDDHVNTTVLSAFASMVDGHLRGKLTSPEFLEGIPVHSCISDRLTSPAPMAAGAGTHS